MLSSVHCSLGSKYANGLCSHIVKKKRKKYIIESKYREKGHALSILGWHVIQHFQRLIVAPSGKRHLSSNYEVIVLFCRLILWVKRSCSKI